MEEKKGNKPEIRIVAPEVKNGETVYKSVGGMWKNTTKKGEEYYVVKIGDLRLLGYKNTQSVQKKL